MIINKGKSVFEKWNRNYVKTCPCYFVLDWAERIIWKLLLAKSKRRKVWESRPLCKIGLDICFPEKRYLYFYILLIPVPHVLEFISLLKCSKDVWMFCFLTVSRVKHKYIHVLGTFYSVTTGKCSYLSFDLR